MRDWEEAKDKRITQLRKGILELAVMRVLFHERHYGYSLVRVLSQGDANSLKEGTVYPILARLDRDGLVRSEWVESDQGPPRKYYSLTSDGRRLFTELGQEFDLLVSLVKQDGPVDEDRESVERPLGIRRRGTR
jgi:PadR family transcriptional regulator, regulatory protein PadR